MDKSLTLFKSGTIYALQRVCMSGFARQIRSFIIPLVLMLSGFAASGQNAASEMSGCLQSGNAACLSRHIGSAVTMTLASERGTYSRAQAEMVLRDFFKKNDPKGFKMAKSSDSHIIGILATEKGNFRVFIALSSGKGGYFVQEIRIEK